MYIKMLWRPRDMLVYNETLNSTVGLAESCYLFDTSSTLFQLLVRHLPMQTLRCS
jgi:hypothetical protein